MTGFHSTRRLIPLLYLAGGLLLADQAADLIGTMLAQPVMPGSPEWRFGAAGLLVTRASVVLVGDVLLFTAAVLMEHRRVVRLLGVIHLLLAALLLASLIVFVLDAVQVRRLVREGGQGAFDLAAVRAGILILAGAALLGWAGLVTWRMTRSGSRRGAGPIMVGRPPKPEAGSSARRPT